MLMITSSIVLHEREKIMKGYWRGIVNDFKELNLVKNTTFFAVRNQSLECIAFLDNYCVVYHLRMHLVARRCTFSIRSILVSRFRWGFHTDTAYSK